MSYPVTIYNFKEMHAPVINYIRKLYYLIAIYMQDNFKLNMKASSWNRHYCSYSEIY